MQNTVIQGRTILHIQNMNFIEIHWKLFMVLILGQICWLNTFLRMLKIKFFFPFKKIFRLKCFKCHTAFWAQATFLFSFFSSWSLNRLEVNYFFIVKSACQSECNVMLSSFQFSLRHWKIMTDKKKRIAFGDVNKLKAKNNRQSHYRYFSSCKSQKCRV